MSEALKAKSAGAEASDEIAKKELLFVRPEDDGHYSEKNLKHFVNKDLDHGSEQDIKAHNEKCKACWKKTEDILQDVWDKIGKSEFILGKDDSKLHKKKDGGDQDGDGKEDEWRKIRESDVIRKINEKGFLK